VTIFLFHRDLRLVDNTALNAAVALGRPVMPVFIFDPAQCDPTASVAANERANAYYSHPAVQFMCESLVSLHAELAALGSRLWVFSGNTLGVLKGLAKVMDVRAIAYNEDYTIFARDRDAAVAKWAESAGIDLCTREDYGLMGMAEGMLEGPGGGQRPYMVLSQFYKRFLKTVKVRPADTHRLTRAAFLPSGGFKDAGAVDVATLAPARATFYRPLHDLAVHGGRAEAVATLGRIREVARHYAARRDLPAVAGTTRASPHLRFGTFSVREMYWAIRAAAGPDNALIRELVFRDFYMKIYAADPRLQRGRALLDALDKALPWVYGATERQRFAAWAEARTGYPLVDAGMRELLATGWQHNRVRMLCASVLSKYFLVDWRKGAQFYYRHLEDADAFSNTAGWGFSSSTGPDAVPYFRAPFNPFIQSKKFDADAAYIKRWLPELADVAAADIHKWDDAAVRARYADVKYPAPLILPKEASAAAVAAYKKAAAATKAKQ
jgi:deoxyribodipyrimidine photo-lyase